LIIKVDIAAAKKYLSMKINTVIFDMDGLLLDTEPLWGKSMWRIAAQNKTPITPERFKETTGLHIYEVTQYWSIKYPWEGKTPQEVAEEILDDIIASAQEYGKLMPGIQKALDYFKMKGYKIGLASSSPTRMIDALVNHFNIRHYFDVVTSADEVDFGKPHPAVFLRCAAHLKTNPLECVVFEDSVNGVIAAKAARMKVIAIPENNYFEDPRFAIADEKWKSMEEINKSFLLKEIFI